MQCVEVVFHFLEMPSTTYRMFCHSTLEMQEMRASKMLKCKDRSSVYSGLYMLHMLHTLLQWMKTSLKQKALLL